MLPPSSGLKNKPSKKPALTGNKQSQASYLLHAGFLFRLFFDPEHGGDMFPGNCG
jgi:hypothetical protein